MKALRGGLVIWQAGATCKKIEIQRAYFLYYRKWTGVVTLLHSRGVLELSYPALGSISKLPETWLIKSIFF